MNSRSWIVLALVSSISLISFGCAQSEFPSDDSPVADASHSTWVEPVTLTTSDGVTIFGDMHHKDGSHALLLLFHQAGADGRSEYGPLLPQLLEAGYDALVIDQRVGGSRFGGVNRTALGLEAGAEYGYCDAYPDLEAALAHVASINLGLPIIAWGSSYSAALVVRLAAEHGDELAGILAFSPASGEPLKDCDPLDYSTSLGVPALFMRPASEMTNARTAKQLETLADRGYQTYVADPGVHGSSMLNVDRVEGNVDDTWEVVLNFLESATHGS